MTSDLGCCAEVLPDLPTRIADGTLTYRIPEALRGAVRVGIRVLVPLGPRTARGIVLEIHPCAEVVGRTIREILEILDPEPLVSPHLLALASWVADETLSTLQEAVRCLIPSEITRLRTPSRRPVTPGAFRTAEAARPSAPPIPGRDRAMHAISGIGSDERPTLVWGDAEARLSWIVEAAAAAVGRGVQTLVVVPEIARAPSLVERLRAVVGDQVAAFHSGLSPRHRATLWKQIRAGELDVLVGTRSALFAPLDRVGLIVVDEEQDPSFKAEAAPRYHGREVALHRGRLEGARVVLGSPTPSLESYAAALSGDLSCLRLPPAGPEARVTVVDMRTANPKGPTRRPALLSAPLVEAIRRHLRAGGRVVLFVNRVGYARVLLCQECGYAVRCPRCEVAMPYDRQSGTLHCRVCGHGARAPEVCPRCKGVALRWVGPGTKRVEEVVRRVFPALGIARVDRETASLFPAIAGAFAAGRVRLVIGTQLLLRARQLRPSLVGVIDADHPLHLPDFRATERAFQLLRAVVSLAGAPPGPEAVVQTRVPDHPAIVALQADRDEDLYRGELEVRREFGYPPFTHLARLVAGSPDRSAAHALAERAAAAAREQGVEVLGPAPARGGERSGRFHVQVLLRSPERQAVRTAAREALAAAVRPRSARLWVEIDPQELSSW